MAISIIGTDGVEHVVAGVGADGAPGKSAYQSAVDGGYSGTEAEFNATMAGALYKSANGTIDAKDAKIVNVGAGVADTDAATIAQLTARIEALEAKLTPSITEAKTTADNALPLSGGTMAGDIATTKAIKPLSSNSAGIYLSKTTQDDLVIDVDKGTSNIPMLELGMNSGRFRFSVKNKDTTSDSSSYMRVSGIQDPSMPHDAANKQYVDSMAGGISLQKQFVFMGKMLSTSDELLSTIPYTGDIAYIRESAIVSAMEPTLFQGFIKKGELQTLYSYTGGQINTIYILWNNNNELYARASSPFNFSGPFYFQIIQ